MDCRPVLYLDLDDTLISWGPDGPAAAPGAGEFVRWAIGNMEVRWLTTWCPDGVMDQKLLGDLAKMLNLAPDEIGHIRGFEWDRETSKLNGVAWLEHIVLGRPFVWLEDEYGFGERERAFLAHHNLLGCHLHCNVTDDPKSLARVQPAIRSWLEHLEDAAA